MIKHLLYILFIVFVSQTTFSQNKELKPPSFYKVNYKWEVPMTAGLYIFQPFGFELVNSKSTLTMDEINQLDANDIWKFDRRATQQDASGITQAHEISDIVMYTSVALPLLLAFDSKIRKDWLPITFLYLETHAVNFSLYFLSTGVFDRIRPSVYNTEVPDSDKMSSGTKNSFFSGHTSTTASSTFFMAKVYSDYHPELGYKKYLIYGAALIPPLVVGYYRYKAMRHFPTDIITGLTVGAAVGILVPHLHKRKNSQSNFSFFPYVGGVNGMTIHYSIR